MTSEPTYEDWLKAIPIHRRDIFAQHFELGRSRMVEPREPGDPCPCLICTEKTRDAMSGISR